MQRTEGNVTVTNPIKKGISIMKNKHSVMSERTIARHLPSGRNAGIYLSNEFIDKIDRARGDVIRSTWVKRAIEKRLKEMETGN
jgi:hypothetical protein